METNMSGLLGPWDFLCHHRMGVVSFQIRWYYPGQETHGKLFSRLDGFQSLSGPLSATLHQFYSLLVSILVTKMSKLSCSKVSKTKRKILIFYVFTDPSSGKLPIYSNTPTYKLLKGPLIPYKTSLKPKITEYV
jgi:hypothetical protein